jgi:hypothetical protein
MRAILVRPTSQPSLTSSAGPSKPNLHINLSLVTTASIRGAGERNLAKKRFLFRGKIFLFMSEDSAFLLCPLAYQSKL